VVRLLAIVALVAWVVGCMPATASHAPTPPDAGQSPYYFPTRVGTKWVSGWSGRDDDDCGHVVIRSVEKDGRYLVTVKATGVDWVDDERTTYWRYEVSRDGLVKRSGGWESENEPDDWMPYVLLKLPHREGEKWKHWPEDDRVVVTGPVETVKVTAGTFEAIRVDRKDKDEPCSFWYAPGVGLVKNQGKTSGIELKSFTLPKD
jgi:hypothetical protein